MANAKHTPARHRPSRQEWPPILSQEIADAIAEREGRTRSSFHQPRSRGA